MSKKFKITLFIRTLGYTLFFSGILGIFLVFGPVIQAEFAYRKDQLFGVKRTVATVAIAPNAIGTNPSPDTFPSLTFGDIKSQQDVIIPASTQFGLVIPKINANAIVIANVDPSNEKSYVQALTKGVAHAAGTNFPGEIGNIYLFSHSTNAPWNVIRYNAIFYLLRELDSGDEVVVFYNNRRYDYSVFDKQIVGPDDVSYLTNKYDESILTLQTCDPPGTLLHRLIVRAKLAGT